MNRTDELTKEVQAWDRDRRSGAVDPRDPSALATEFIRLHGEQLRRQRWIITSEPPHDELVAIGHEMIDQVNSVSVKDRARAVRKGLAGGMERQKDGTYRERRGSLVEALGVMAMNQDVTWRDLIWIFPELAKVQLERIIRSTPYEAGPSISDRRRLLAECEARIREIEEQHGAVSDAAAACSPPIVIELLPNEKRRREIAARRQQLDADKRAAREKAENAVDAQFNPKSKVLTAHEETGAGRSQYIEQNRGA